VNFDFSIKNFVAKLSCMQNTLAYFPSLPVNSLLLKAIPPIYLFRFNIPPKMEIIKTCKSTLTISSIIFEEAVCHIGVRVTDVLRWVHDNWCLIILESLITNKLAILNDCLYQWLCGRGRFDQFEVKYGCFVRHVVSKFWVLYFQIIRKHEVTFQQLFNETNLNDCLVGVKELKILKVCFDVIIGEEAEILANVIEYQVIKFNIATNEIE